MCLQGALQPKIPSVSRTYYQSDTREGLFLEEDFQIWWGGEAIIWNRLLGCPGQTSDTFPILNFIYLFAEIDIRGNGGTREGLVMKDRYFYESVSLH